MSDRTAVVRRQLKAPAQALFDTLADPGRLATVRGIKGVEVLRAGPEGPVSVGTIRKVSLAAGFLVEEIVGLEHGTRFDYLIRDASLPFDHRFGRIEFHDRGHHTEATWTTTVAFDRSVVGGMLGLASGPVLSLAFTAALREIDRAARRTSNAEQPYSARRERDR